MPLRRTVPRCPCDLPAWLPALAAAVLLAVGPWDGHAAGKAPAPPSPDDWARHALARCVEIAERLRVADDRLEARLTDTAQSREQSAFLERERAIRARAGERQRDSGIARLDTLLFGSKRRLSDLARAIRGEAFRLSDVLGDADACALEAIEATTFYSVFGLSFDARDVTVPDRAGQFAALAAAIASHRSQGRTLEEIFAVMRPHDTDEALAHVRAVALAALGAAGPGSTPGTTPDLDRRLDRLLEAMQLAAEPLRIDTYLHWKVQEIEGALGVPVPESASERLARLAGNLLFRDLAAMRRLRGAAPTATLAVLTPLLDEWFRTTALPHIRRSLARDPFTAYWYFVQSGATAEPGAVFKGSRTTVEPTVVLASLERLPLAAALTRVRTARVPRHFVEQHAALERVFSSVTLSEAEALARIDRSTADRNLRQRLRGFVRSHAGSAGFSTIDVYSTIVRDASKIPGRVDWDVAEAALDPRRSAPHQLPRDHRGVDAGAGAPPGKGAALPAADERRRRRLGAQPVPGRRRGTSGTLGAGGGVGRRVRRARRRTHPEEPAFGQSVRGQASHACATRPRRARVPRHADRSHRNRSQLHQRLAVRLEDRRRRARHRVSPHGVEDPNALRRFVGRFGLERQDRPDEPFPINIVADSKQTFFNHHPRERSPYFPYLGGDPIRDIYFPLLEFDIRLVLWKGPLEFPWHAGPVPLPGRKLFGVIPMPFIPYPWVNLVPGFGWAGPVTAVFLQYLLASDVRVYWAMVNHTKSWSNESMAFESGMGMGSKYFNQYDEHKTWHDRGRVSCEGLSDLACASARRDAVRIHLVLPDSSDKPIVDAVGAADFYEMLHLGIKIHRWRPAEGWSAARMLHTKAWLIDYEPGEGGLTYVGAANATQRSHLADNEAGLLSTSPELAREVYERLFRPDVTTDSRLEPSEGLHVVRGANPAVRASRWLRRVLVDLFWFI